MPKCWICEVNDADSGEHLILHSVLREIFQNITQAKPAYFHNNRKSNKPVASFKQDVFKFPKVICSHCNNSKTQKHDEAFGLFFQYMTNNRMGILNSRRVNLGKIFKNEKVSANELYLYFFKIYGCMLAATQKKLASASWFQLRESILQNKLFFTDICLGLQIDYELLEREAVGASYLVDKAYQGWLLYLQWFTVFITHPFALAGKGWGKAWNPGQSKNTVIKIGTYKN